MTVENQTRAILEELYYALGGPYWYKQCEASPSGSCWLSSDSVCRWYGIFCTTSGRFALTLSANGLRGINSAHHYVSFTHVASMTIHVHSLSLFIHLFVFVFVFLNSVLFINRVNTRFTGQSDKLVSAGFVSQLHCWQHPHIDTPTARIS